MGFASGPAGDSLPATITPSHTAMRCFRLPAVGRCGGVADDGHTITHTATITHGHALLPTACILGGASHTATITPSHTAMRCFRLPAVGRCGGVADDGHTITRTAAIIPPRPCAASDCLRWVAAVVPLMTATPSHARPPSYRHGHALLAFGIWGGLQPKKNGRRWGNYGGGVSVGFFGYHVFLLHPEVLSCWLLVFYLLNFLFFFNY